MSSGKGKEKEAKVRKKPGRVPTACAECRRLKFKCDKNIPCAKCVSRGCGSICPDGVLAQGRGGRLVLANTEELHGQIDDLSSRNRELEKALRALQANQSSEPHPLLQSDTIRLILQPESSPSQSNSSSSKSPTGSSAPAAPEPMDIEEDEELFKVDAFGTMSLQEGGEMCYFGRTAQPECLLPSMDRWSQPSTRLNARITQLGWPNAQIPTEIVDDILNYLPPSSVASHMCDVYLDHGTLFCTSISQAQLREEILPQIYQSRPSSEFTAYGSLSLLLIVFAIATLLENDNRSSLTAYDYYRLSRAAHPFTHSSFNTTLESIQALAHMSHFLEFCDDTMDHIHSRWKHAGDAVRSVLGAGLHLDASKWKLSTPEVQRRNHVFWSVFVADTWTSFALGRPPSMSNQSHDCHPPLAIRELVALTGSSKNDYSTWRIHFTILLNEIMHTAFGPKQPTYTTILGLDRQIRDFHLPVAWKIPEEGDSISPPAHISFCRFLVVLTKETVLLNLHRAFFVQALQESGLDLSRHRYLPSVVAVYRSALRLIRALARVWVAVPQLLLKLKTAWSSAVSASVALALLVTRSPNSHLATSANEELENVASLFDDASSTSQAASSLQPYIQRIHRKARDAAISSHGRLSASGHGGQPSESQESAITTADLEYMSGKTRFCGHNTPTGQTASVEMGSASRATSVTISENADTSSHPSLFQHMQTETLHPTLLRDLKEFGIRSSIHPTSSFSFYDQPSDLNHTRAAPGSLSGSGSSPNHSILGDRRPSPTHLHPSAAAAGGGGGSTSQIHPQPGPSQPRHHVKGRDMYDTSREPISERHGSGSGSSSTPPLPPPSPDASGSYHQSQHQSYESHHQQQHHQHQQQQDHHHSSSTYLPQYTNTSAASSHVASIPAAGNNSVMFSYFHPSSFHYEPYMDARRGGYNGTLNTSPVPPGMMPSTPSGLPGFPGAGVGGGYAAAGFTSSVVLDSSWSGFVEQLGF